MNMFSVILHPSFVWLPWPLWESRFPLASTPKLTPTPTHPQSPYLHRDKRDTPMKCASTNTTHSEMLGSCTLGMYSSLCSSRRTRDSHPPARSIERKLPCPHSSLTPAHSQTQGMCILGIQRPQCSPRSSCLKWVLLPVDGPGLRQK